ILKVKFAGTVSAQAQAAVRNQLVEHAVQGPSPEWVTQVSQLWAEASVQAVDTFLKSENIQTLELLSQQLAVAQSKLDAAQQQQQVFSAQDRISQLNQAISTLTARLVTGQNRLDEIDDAMRIALVRIARLQARAEGGTVDLQALTQAGDAAAMLAAAEAALSDAERRLEEFDAVDRITLLETDLAQLTSVVGSDQARLVELERQLAANQARQEQLSAQLEEISTEVTAIVSSGVTAIVSSGGDQVLEGDPRVALLRTITAGMSLDDAVAELGQWRARVQQEWEATQERLEQFRSGQQIDLLQAQISATVSSLAAIDNRLLTMETDISTTQAALAVLEAQLAAEPRLLELSKQLLNDPTLLESLRSQGVDPRALLQLRLSEEQVNPAYFDALAQQVRNRVRLQSLQAERASLQGQLAQLGAVLHDLQTQVASQLRTRDRLELEEAQARANLQIVEQEYQRLANARGEGRGDRHLRRDNPDYVATRAAIDQVLVNQAALLAEQQAINNRLGGLQQQVLAKQGELTVARVRRNRLDALVSAAQEVFPQLVALEAERRELVSRIAADEPALATLRAQLAEQQVQRQTVELAVTQAQQEYTAVSQALASKQIEGSSFSGQLRLVSPAVAPNRPVSPRRLLSTAVAGVLGLMLGVMAAFIAEGLTAPPGPGLRPDGRDTERAAGASQGS
ncbi:MAG: hypothetical protein HY335_00005, partial [Deinococcus sp.]|nr:hypothetical protein [Deinococcus sp.]